MTVISQFSIEKARFEPEAVFVHPSEIVAETLLTRGQKIASLGRWRLHLVDKLRATGEGMQPSADETATEADLLSEVGCAHFELATLDESPGEPMFAHHAT